MTSNRADWKNYLWQSLLAAVSMFLVLVLLSLQRAVIVASVGATAFIVFMKPGNPFAAPRNVIGGHLVGLAAGLIFALIPPPRRPSTSCCVHWPWAVACW